MRYRILAVFLLVATMAFGQSDLPEKPNPWMLVTDLTGNTLRNSEIDRLERKLRSYADTTSTQIAILIEPSLRGYDRVDRAQRIAQEWGVGQKGKDNGILILVAINDRKSAIVTGYGMEGAIPDITAAAIQDDYMRPNFRNNDYYRGLDEATDVIFKLASGEYTADQVARGRSSNKARKGIPFFFLFVLFFFVFPALLGRRRGRNSMGRRSFPWWIFLLGNGSGGRRNDWDNFRGGGGGFGGFGGGSGFGGGGFGGGSFGGGGAGGSW